MPFFTFYFLGVCDVIQMWCRVRVVSAGSVCSVSGVGCLHGFSFCWCSGGSHAFSHSPGFRPGVQSHASSWTPDISMWLPASLRQLVLSVLHRIFLPLFPILIQFRESQPARVKICHFSCSPHSVAHRVLPLFHCLPRFHAVFIFLCLCGHNNLVTRLTASTSAPSNPFCTSAPRRSP